MGKRLKQKLVMFAICMVTLGVVFIDFIVRSFGEKEFCWNNIAMYLLMTYILVSSMLRVLMKKKIKQRRRGELNKTNERKLRKWYVFSIALGITAIIITVVAVIVELSMIK